MNLISDGCRLCLDASAQRFTTIDCPALKDQMEKVFCFTIEPKHGYCSGVCQNCSHTISEFYQYSEKVRQNQEVLDGNVTHCDQPKDLEISLECVKQEPLNDFGLPETLEDAHEPGNEISESEEAPILDPKIPLECVKHEPLNDYGFSETIKDANEPNSQSLEAEEAPILDSKISQEHDKVQTPSDSEMMETNQDTCELIDKISEVEKAVHTLQSEITLADFKIENTDSDFPDTTDEEEEFPILDSKITFESGTCETPNKSDLSGTTEKIVWKTKNRKEEDELFKKHISLVCDLCGISADSYRTLLRHFKEEHKRTKSYVMCCNKKLVYRCEIREHINFHANLDMFRCEVCGISFTRRTSLKRHMLKKHPQTHKCELCTKSFAEKSALTEHKKLHIKCPKCKKVCTIQSIHKHMYRNHGVRTIICDICNKKFATIKCLDQHKKMHTRSSTTETNLATEELQCDKCPRKFKDPPALSLHKRRSHAEPKHVCEYCDKKFKRAYKLKEHLASHIGEDLYTCEHCEISNNSSVAMYMHMKRHHPEEWAQKKLMKTKGTDSTDEFLCDNCPKKFKNYKTFYAHKRWWHTEPKHECEHCGLKFRNAFMLKDHIAVTHTGEDLHTCEDCGKSYASRKKMAYHMRRYHPAEWEQKKQIKNKRINSSEK